jgi:hypothetical protein
MLLSVLARTNLVIKTNRQVTRLYRRLFKIHFEYINTMTPKQLQLYLAEYARSMYSYTLNYNSNNIACYHESRRIDVHHAQSDVQKCISALHELGHCAQSESELVTESSKAGLQSYIIAQEISAWSEGWTIYKSIPTPVSDIELEYWSTAAKCIAAYIQHVNRISKTQLAYIAGGYSKPVLHTTQ